MIDINETAIIDNLSYIKAINEPLSADITIIRCKDKTILFDVGNSKDVTDYLNSLPGDKYAVISHFHEDHLGAFSNTDLKGLFVSAQSNKYITEGLAKAKVKVVSDIYILSEDPLLKIIPLPSSHAKGCLALMINDEYLCVGDGIFACQKDDKIIHNAQKLKELIDLLSLLPAKKLLVSHEKRFIYDKRAVLAQLSSIYSKRTPDSNYIEL